MTLPQAGCYLKVQNKFHLLKAKTRISVTAPGQGLRFTMVQSCKSQRTGVGARTWPARARQQLRSARSRGLFAAMAFQAVPAARRAPGAARSRGGPAAAVTSTARPLRRPLRGMVRRPPGLARSNNGPRGPFPPPSRGGGRRKERTRECRGAAIRPEPRGHSPSERCQGPAAPRPCGRAAAPQAPPSSGRVPGAAE